MSAPPQSGLPGPDQNAFDAPMMDGQEVAKKLGGDLAWSSPTPGYDPAPQGLHRRVPLDVDRATVVAVSGLELHPPRASTWLVLLDNLQTITCESVVVRDRLSKAPALATEYLNPCLHNDPGVRNVSPWYPTADWGRCHLGT